MRRVPFLHGQTDFPPSCDALENPNGLLAAGGDLSVPRLISAYQRGIFPWYEFPQPVLWWTPNPRSVLFLDELHISRSLRKTLKSDSFRLAVDQQFAEVMQECASPRREGGGTWIGQDMLSAYAQLHDLGLAHSVEVHDTEGKLVGGLYGVALGRIFFGESMFSRVDDASKVALVALVHILKRGSFHMIDCQVENDHLNSLGARNIDRLDFEQRLKQTVDVGSDSAIWQLPASCGDLL